MAESKKNLTVLVTGDNPKIRSSVVESLTDGLGHAEIQYARNLADASHSLDSGQAFDVHLIDFSPHKTDQEQLTSWLLGNTNAIPVILLTDDDNNKFISELSEYYNNLDYLPKDRIDPFLLKKSINHCIERKIFRQYLNKSERQYRELFVINPVPMYIYDVETYRFLDMNEAAVKTYGYTKEEFLELTIKDIRPNKELPKLEKVLQEQKINDELAYRGTFTHIKRNGSYIQVEIQSKFTTVNGKRAKLVLANNVTERLKAQEALRLSEQRFRSLVQDGSDLITIINMKGVYQYVSPTSKNVLGISPETFLGTSSLHYIHPDDRGRVIDELAELPQKKHIRLTPFRHIDNKNNWRWLDSTITYMLDDPAVHGIVTNSRDITEKVIRELKLKQSINRYDIISRATSDTIWEYDIHNDVIRYNDGINDMFGYKQKTIENTREWWTNNVHPEERHRILDKLDQIRKNGESRFQLQYRFRCVDGTYKCIYDRAFVVSDENGKPVRVIGAMQDITELMDKRKELQRKNEQLKTAPKIAKLGYWSHNLTTEQLTWSDEIYKLWGLDPNTFEPTFTNLISYIHPDDRSVFTMARNTTLATGDSFDAQFRILTPDGQMKWLMSRITIHYDDHGKPVLLEGISQDITENKKREIKLKETIDRYDILSRATSDAIWDADIPNNVIQHNQTFCEIFGYEPSEIANTSGWWQSKIHPHDRQKVLDEVFKTFEMRKQRLQLEFRFKCADESYKYIYTRAFLVLDENGKPIRMLGAMQDMTELLTKKKELQTANQQLKTAHRIAKMGYWTARLSSKKTEWSEELCEIHGVDPETFTPSLHAWLETIHPDDRILVDEHLNKLMHDKNHHDFDHRIITPDGQVKWLLQRVTLHRNEDGTPKSIDGITEDITERKLQEAKILASLEEKETLLAEIHHRVKNNLAVVSSLMQLQVFREENPELSNKLVDSVSRIKTMAIIHEQLYQSNSFANLEFCKNLQKLVLSIIETLSSGTRITHSFHCKPIHLNINQAVPCALIVNEVVTNILKHAFRGREEGEISIYFSEEQNKLRLEIRDNGRGMPKNLNPASGKTLGLHLVDTLSRQLEADYHFDSSDGNGTSFTLTFAKS